MKVNRFRIAGLLILLVIAMAAFTLLWLYGRQDHRTAGAASEESEEVAQCLYEKEGSIPGDFRNVIYDENRRCFAATYNIPSGIDHVLIPSYGEKRESLKFPFPLESDMSERLRQIHGVQSKVHIQIWPHHFRFQNEWKINSANSNDALHPSQEDERFGVVKRPMSESGTQTRLYYSSSDQIPFRLLCASTRVRSNGKIDHNFCYVWTRTCNGLTLRYTIFGPPFDKLEEVDGIIQAFVRPLFDYCE